MPAIRKYVGLELGGVKSARTAVVVLDCYQHEKKVFVSALHSKLQSSDALSSDQTLLEIINKLGAESIGVNAPLSFAPCISCELVCPSIENCKVPQVVWMREEMARENLGLPTPYTQRAVDVLLRSHWRKEFSDLPLEDTMGSGRAPLAARMNYLQRHIHCKKIFEVNPRLSLAEMQGEFEINARELRRYRELEDGVEHRTFILDRLNSLDSDPKIPKLFLYNTDVFRLAKDLASFDALVNAMVAMYADFGLVKKPDFDAAWGNLVVPLRRQRRRSTINEIDIP